MLLFFSIAFAVLRISALHHLTTRDAPLAEEQLVNLTNQIDNLLTVVDDFPSSGGTTTQLSDIITLYQNVTLTTVNATISLEANIGQNGPATESDAAAFLNLIQATYVPVITNLLDTMINTKSIFENTDEGAVSDFESVLVNYNASNADYLATLITGTPADLLSNATEIQNEVNSLFATTIADYSS